VDEPTDWHWLFALSWKNLLFGEPATVEAEVDLSVKQQLLDLVIVHVGNEPIRIALPDGFDTFGRHNLISFKSHQDTLDAWAMEELIGHYVNYRKQISPSMRELLPEDQFRLFAVSARYPAGLAQETTLDLIRPGVFEARRFRGVIRVIVTSQLPTVEANAHLHLFTNQPERIAYGREHFRSRDPEMTTFLSLLYAAYRAEGLIMPFSLEEWVREAKRKIVRDIPPEERLEGLSPEQVLAGLSPEDREALRRLLNAQSQAQPNSPEAPKDQPPQQP
jgi:hypothetical protein